MCTDTNQTTGVERKRKRNAGCQHDIMMQAQLTGALQRVHLDDKCVYGVMCDAALLRAERHAA